VCAKNVTEIPTEMKEVMWIGVKCKTSPYIKVCMSFIYKAPQNSRWYNPNFTKELEGDIYNLRDSCGAHGAVRGVYTRVSQMKTVKLR
jgi:hypothetical protein